MLLPKGTRKSRSASAGSPDCAASGLPGGIVRSPPRSPLGGGTIPGKPPPNRPPIKGRRAGLRPALQKLPLGIEPKTSSLPMKCSTPELRQRALSRPHLPYRPNPTRQPFPRTSPQQNGRRDLNPQQLAWKASTLPLSYSRTLDCGLRQSDFGIKSCVRGPQSALPNPTPAIPQWVERDSNPRTRERPDLQSGAFDRSAIYPLLRQLATISTKPEEGFEPTTYGLQNRCSTPELRGPTPVPRQES